MSKGSKTKKDKVPKITEEEYNRYVSALKGETPTEKPTLQVQVHTATVQGMEK